MGMVRQLIRSASAKLFFLPKILPRSQPHRTDLAKIKYLRRKAAARTSDAVNAAIGELSKPSHLKNAATIS
jgi:transposase